MSGEGQITVTQLQRVDGRWEARVNGIPVMTLGKSGLMAVWVSKPRRSDRHMHEVAPAVRVALIKKVRQQLRAEEAQDAPA